MAQSAIQRFTSLTAKSLTKTYLSNDRCDLAHQLSDRFHGLEVRLKTSKSLEYSELQSCFNLIQETSKSLYSRSCIGWSSERKLEEMRLDDMRYLLLTTGAGPTGEEIRGFMSFMATYEDERPCIYCYELHLETSLRGMSIGTELMRWLERIAGEAEIHLLMLTVFTKNLTADKFYRRLGFEVDEISPQARRLRSGRVLEPEYSILAKSTLLPGDIP